MTSWWRYDDVLRSGAAGVHLQKKGCLFNGPTLRTFPKTGLTGFTQSKLGSLGPIHYSGRKLGVNKLTKLGGYFLTMKSSQIHWGPRMSPFWTDPRCRSWWIRQLADHRKIRSAATILLMVVSMTQHFLISEYEKERDKEEISAKLDQSICCAEQRGLKKRRKKKLQWKWNLLRSSSWKKIHICYIFARVAHSPPGNA